jgi:plasmid maintenance system antidote protein VapI
MPNKGLYIDRERLRGALWGNRDMVADALQIAPSSLSRKIHHGRQLTLDDLNQIARALGRDTQEFIIEREMESDDSDGN